MYAKYFRNISGVRNPDVPSTKQLQQQHWFSLKSLFQCYREFNFNTYMNSMYLWMTWCVFKYNLNSNMRIYIHVRKHKYDYISVNLTLCVMLLMYYIVFKYDIRQSCKLDHNIDIHMQCVFMSRFQSNFVV